MVSEIPDSIPGRAHVSFSLYYITDNESVEILNKPLHVHCHVLNFLTHNTSGKLLFCKILNIPNLTLTQLIKEPL